MIRGICVMILMLAMAFQGAFAQLQSVIEGRIQGEGPQDIRLVYNKVPFINKPLELRAKTDSSGKFFIEFPLDKAASIDFYHGQHSISLIISPGDSFYMNIAKADSLYDYVLSGRGFEETYLNYLNFKNFDREVIKTFHDQVKTLTPAAYDKKVQEWMGDFAKVLKENLKFLNADKTFRRHAENMGKIKEANYYLIYANYHKQLADRNNTKYILPESFEKVLTNKTLFEIDHTPNPEYQNFLLLHLTTLGPGAQQNVCEGVIGFLDFIDSVYARKSHDELMARVLWEGMDNGCFKAMRVYYDAYVATSMFPDYVETLQAKAAQLATLEPGDMAPDFEFRDK
ncbi:MAG: hypothetical protein LPK45_07850, partial [Bacteroidota bacterium]|nr:hypothetical protein [Bacteroidota bacterium]MDX5430983.1 hypothetical protein [Bacteroidota bacterium]MDX5469734.1 hypothetical protein [Bacteroidota bacterium]